MDIPGPSTFEILKAFMPGGRLYNANVIAIEEFFREQYGDIVRLKGTLGKADTVFTFNPADFEVTYRNEGPWPVRIGLESFAHYRMNVRPEIFQGVAGLVTSQGRSWGEIRNKVNPVMMKVQNIRQNLPAIDEIAQEFLTRFDTLIDPSTGRLTADLTEEIKMWALESVALVALNTRMGLFSRHQVDAKAQKLVDNMTVFLNMAYHYDVSPSFWRYFETPGFKKLIKALDNITEVTTDYIEKAMAKFASEQNVEGKSVLEKLYRIDKKVAMVMAMDMLMAGMDTTSSAFISTLYLLSTNPEKQEALRKELLTLLPQENAPLTQENTKNLPYLRACIKEALRFKPIATANFRFSGHDLVLSGYRVPKGVGVFMANMSLCNSEEYFERNKEFLPERWLKSQSSSCPITKKNNPFVYLPFGFGPRTCIGKRLAEMELETLLTRLFRNYRVTWESEKPLEYKSNIVLMPCGEMHFKFERL
ncbi:cytochrome P450 12b1, mitochondrial-like [Rhagoletis pomonella]|uniref:cytochrome P450 12b1, mitochondrial-like n=1 Tax=Rhagoletis pomonella TaxID=28610 RepID=UPI00177B1A47|nr:cytochrome P450 12b1, mitochondrial-like [Rhagoletis pomonella]